MGQYVPRELEQAVQQNMKWYPIVSISGPRQSGKSTLARKMFPDYQYVNLEQLQLRSEAQLDPVGFINNRPDHLIIDEAQYVPEIYSMIQAASDERGTTGQYILTGSQNFLMLKNIQQSLAGRVGLLKLLPFSYRELSHTIDISIDDFAFNGGYPKLHDLKIDSENYFENYIDTYITRDIEDLLQLRNVPEFRKFLVICATQVGGLLNYTAIANAAEVSVKTVRDWISILEQSYIIFLLPSYSENVRKRIIKSPKLYFYDTGLLCYLLDIANSNQLIFDTRYGSIFENACIADAMKYSLNQGKRPRLYYYRDENKREIDLIKVVDSSTIQAFEIKASQTYRDKFSRHLTSVGDELDIARENRFVVTRIEHSFNPPQATVLSAEDFLLGNY